jgi:PncC family amidohydrolase
MLRAFLDALGPGTGAAARVLYCSGLSEAEAGDRIADLMDEQLAGCRVGITVTTGIMKVSARGEDVDALDTTIAAAQERLGDAVFLRSSSAEGDSSGRLEDGTSLEAVVVAELSARGLTVSTAESCTGGLLAGALTSVSGSSTVFREGVVTYSNQAKAERLGVAADLLAEHGAVSEPVAAAMAEGQRQRSGADVALSITGIAGPGGGTPGKPVGTVVFGLADAAGTQVVTRRWSSGREAVRAFSVNYALELLRRWLRAGEP